MLKHNGSYSVFNYNFYFLTSENSLMKKFQFPSSAANWNLSTGSATTSNSGDAQSSNFLSTQANGAIVTGVGINGSGSASSGNDSLNMLAGNNAIFFQRNAHFAAGVASAQFTNDHNTASIQQQQQQSQNIHPNSNVLIF